MVPSKISSSKILTNSKLFNGCVLHYTWLLLITLLITIWIILPQAIKMLKWFKAHCKLLFSVFCVLLIRLITCDMTYNQVWWPHTRNLCSAINPSKAHTHTASGGHRSSTWVKVQIRVIKYYSSKSKSTAFSILLEWKYKSTQFFMYLSKKVLIDRFILQFYIDYFISFYISTYFYNPTAQNTWVFPKITTI